MTPIQRKRTKLIITGGILYTATLTVSGFLAILPPFVAGVYPYIFMNGMNETGIFLYMGFGVLIGLGSLLIGVLWVSKFIASHWKLAEYDCRACGYDLRGSLDSESKACPECGATFNQTIVKAK